MPDSKVFVCLLVRDAKEINLECLRVMNLGLDKSSFRFDIGYRAENLVMDKPKFIAQITILFCSPS